MTQTPTANRIDLQVEGMHCGSCVQSVQRALADVPGVLDASVNLATQRARVEVSNAGMPVDLLLEAVRRVGYGARPIDGNGSMRRAAAGSAAPAPQTSEQRRALSLSLALGLPAMALHHVLGPLLHGSPLARGLITLVELALTAAMLFTVAGRPILLGAWRAVRHRTANMDVLIALGVVSAVAGSIVLWIVGRAAGQSPHELHFGAAAMILMFINVGRFLEARAKAGAASAVAALVARTPRTALRLHNGHVEEVSVDELRVGDRVRVPAHTYVPVDGRIIEGEGAVDESMLTGEAVPIDHKVGDAVFGGTLVAVGLLTIETTATGENSAVARIVRAVEEAQSGRTRAQRIADRVAGVFVPVVVLLALVTLGSWLFAGGEQAALRGLTAMIAVLVVACPCALGLATPTAVMVVTGRAAQRGILVRDAAALEAAGNVDIVAFDKTGTLTTGRMTVARVIDDPTGPATLNEREVLTLAASAEMYAQHPLAEAIRVKAREWDVEPIEPAHVQTFAGLGVRARIGEDDVWVGAAKFLESRHIDLEPVQDRLTQLSADGKTVVLVVVNEKIAGLIALSDRLRPRIGAVITELTNMEIGCVLLTGDHRRVAMAIGAQCGIAHIHAELSPEAKARHIKQLQQQGARVAMVGDGINDAPALARADVGIAIAAGTDVANAAAGISLVSDNLLLVPDAIRLARRAAAVIRQNLFWAFAYNLAALPLAALGHVRPEIAAAAMMFSSLSVVLNSLRLRRA